MCAAYETGHDTINKRSCFYSGLALYVNHTFLFQYNMLIIAFRALKLLVGRQEGHPACKKTEWWDAGVVTCLELGADLHLAQMMQLPLTVSCFSKIQIGSTFWYRLNWVVPEKRAVKWICVCVCVCVCVCTYNMLIC